MKRAISIQSHVVHGYAGNKAAVLPMQLLGIDVCPINTVQFSNHTQYGQWTGSVTPPHEISSLVEGIDKIQGLSSVNGLLTGYLGAPEQVEHILIALDRLQQANPKAIYLLDPVMGHPEKGCIVADGVKEAIIKQAIPKATIVAPNLVELEIITGTTIDTFDQAVAAAKELQAMGPQIVLIKHLAKASKNLQQFEMLLLEGDAVHHIARPLYPFDRHPVGVGDITSAIFFAHYLNGLPSLTAFEKTANSVDRVMLANYLAQDYELRIVEARHQIIAGELIYRAVQL